MACPALEYQRGPAGFLYFNRFAVAAVASSVSSVALVLDPEFDFSLSEPRGVLLLVSLVLSLLMVVVHRAIIWSFYGKKSRQSEVLVTDVLKTISAREYYFRNSAHYEDLKAHFRKLTCIDRGFVLMTAQSGCGGEVWLVNLRGMLLLVDIAKLVLELVQTGTVFPVDAVAVGIKLILIYSDSLVSSFAYCYYSYRVLCRCDCVRQKTMMDRRILERVSGDETLPNDVYGPNKSKKPPLSMNMV